MNEKLRSCGMDELKNTLIDTMQVSRAVNVEMTHHSLGTICKSLKIPYDDSTAHRADFDAQVLSEV
jgi:DNA polymerase-3 subunit alpha (Gram-positive type)